MKELRQQALSYRRRAWGTNFSRDHLSQLLSEHNALWEPTETTDSATDPPTPRPTFDLCHDPDRRSTPRVEALDLPRWETWGGGNTGFSNLTDWVCVLFSAAPVTPVRGLVLSWGLEKHTIQIKTHSWTQLLKRIRPVEKKKKKIQTSECFASVSARLWFNQFNCGTLTH